MKTPTGPPLALGNQINTFTFILSPTFFLDIKMLPKSLKRGASHILSTTEHLFDPTPSIKPFFLKMAFLPTESSLKSL